MLLTYLELVVLLIAMVQKIKSLNPAYKLTGIGDDGTCDCIGLFIGALKRMGIKWIGIHGSNYAARYDIENLKPIQNVNDLEVGDLVFKACSQNSTKHKWDLPKRYHKDGAYYNGDLNDYYHVGIVTLVDPLVIVPLNITHMTSPHMKVDTKLNHNKNSVWSHYGKSKTLLKAAGKIVSPVVVKEPIASSGSEAIVVAKSGSNVFLRMYPDKNCRTWDRVPVGKKVTIVEPGEVWAKVNYGKRKGWYMMAEFLDIVGDGKGKY